MSGMNIHRIVSDIFTKYDHNKNGVIELERPQSQGNVLKRIGNSLANPDERVRSSAQTYSKGDELTINSQVYTQHALFVAADANNDKKLTMEELRTFISQNFDANKNGNLESRGAKIWKAKNELEQFNSAYGERLENYSSITF